MLSLMLINRLNLNYSDQVLLVCNLCLCLSLSLSLCLVSLSYSQLKEEVAKVMGDEAPVESQCLIFAGKILKDDQSVESQAVKDGVTIHLVVRSNKVSMLYIHCIASF